MEPNGDIFVSHHTPLGGRGLREEEEEDTTWLPTKDYISHSWLKMKVGLNSSQWKGMEAMEAICALFLKRKIFVLSTLSFPQVIT